MIMEELVKITIITVIKLTYRREYYAEKKDKNINNNNKQTNKLDLIKKLVR